MKLLRQYIKEILTEDLEGFEKETRGYTYAAGSSANLEFDSIAMNFAKKVKRAWRKNADHAFMKSLNKVHWFESGSSIPLRFKWFLNNPGKDEIATSAYLPGDPMYSYWGGLGVLVDGYVTLAANDMDSIISGYARDYMPDIEEKYKSSGIPKRAGVFNVPFAPVSNFVLDKASFKGSTYADNEFIVDNWKVKALVLGSSYKERGEKPEMIQGAIKLAKDNGIPVVDEYGKEVTDL